MKYQKNEEEKVELLNRRISGNKTYINGIITSWHAQKCMVYWEKTKSYRDNGV